MTAISGEALAESLNALVITLNYRLGIFGFPGLSDSLNLGILDQQMAIEWITTYIDKFGGDPKQVFCISFR